MASITRDSGGDRYLSGPLFNGDLLVLAEEILDLKGKNTLDIDFATETAAKLADRLIMLDIAKSLRVLCDAPGIQSYHSRYGDKHQRTITVPHRPAEWKP